MQVNVQSADNVAIDECLGTLRSAFRGAPFWRHIESMLTPEFHNWKYRPPAGIAAVVTANEGGRIASMLAAVPFRYGRGGVFGEKGWQICDIVTRPEFRGRGAYRRCLDALNREIPRGELLICFPNRNSSHELLKQSFVRVAELTTFARPIMFARDEASKFAMPGRLQSGIDVASAGRFALTKDIDYIYWRYGSHPLHRYSFFSDETPDSPDSLIIWRNFEMTGHSLCVIMEIHAGNAKDYRRLIGVASACAAADRQRAVLIVSNVLGHRAAVRSGFIPIPALLSPRRHVVVARLAGESSSDRGPPNDWHFQFGDWDGL
jgi:hypothetical protein